jgi:peptidoglycan/xylan/chitin deacetylase (PgdA/CDA1 family)/SAM-dependent methyltransferase
MKFPLSVAHLAGLTAFQLAILLAFLDPRLAAIPLAAYVAIGLTAPFLTGFSWFLPITTHGDRKRRQVALSFDDGPDPAVTPAVLDLLDRHGVKAAFFLVGRKAEAHPELVREILARGHDIGNHSFSHDPFVMLKGRERLEEEVARAQEAFKGFGVLPRAFRPPVGIVSPLLWPVLLDHGMFCLNFSCRGADMGNRRVRGLARRILGKVRPGDLILLHDVRPHGCAPEAFLAELEAVLEGLGARSLEVVPPARLLGRALMDRKVEGRGAAEAFYDDLAADYDREQFETAVAMSRTLEQKLFRARADSLLAGAGKVLEIGAGTGIFTLEIAPRCREVHAVDLSRNMLARLETKAAAAGIGNIRAVAADAEEAPFDGPYSAVVSFLAFEYFRDLPGFFRRLAPHMEPGARVYFITARTSFFRFWTQVGNALRQGMWLRSRSRREVTALLKAAGVVEVRAEGHLLKSFLSGGMILEVEGRWPSAPHD